MISPRAPAATALSTTSRAEQPPPRTSRIAARGTAAKSSSPQPTPGPESGPGSVSKRTASSPPENCPEAEKIIGRKSTPEAYVWEPAETVGAPTSVKSGIWKVSTVTR